MPNQRPRPNHSFATAPFYRVRAPLATTAPASEI